MAEPIEMPVEVKELLRGVRPIEKHRKPSFLWVGETMSRAKMSKPIETSFGGLALTDALDGRTYGRHLENTIERSVLGGEQVMPFATITVATV